MSTKKIQVKRFGMVKGGTPEPTIEKIGEYLHAWPDGRNCLITITEGKERRSHEQNALWWAWCNELAAAHDESHEKGYYHAHNKYYVLHQLMLHDDRFSRWKDDAEVNECAFQVQMDEFMVLWLAYRIVESSKLSVAEGSIYTEKLIEHWHEKGVALDVKASVSRYQMFPEYA